MLQTMNKDTHQWRTWRQYTKPQDASTQTQDHWQCNKQTKWPEIVKNEVRRCSKHNMKCNQKNLTNMVQLLQLVNPPLSHKGKTYFPLAVNSNNIQNSNLRMFLCKMIFCLDLLPVVLPKLLTQHIASDLLSFYCVNRNSTIVSI